MQAYISSPILPSKFRLKPQETTESNAFGLFKFKQQVIFVLRQKSDPAVNRSR